MFYNFYSWECKWPSCDLFSTSSTCTFINFILL
uniref:Uncharacterized protein n=1 Tax=Arundo donax TaxID=35708 RepID=A0A0A8ZCU6_ARUDO